MIPFANWLGTPRRATPQRATPQRATPQRLRLEVELLEERSLLNATGILPAAAPIAGTIAEPMVAPSVLFRPIGYPLPPVPAPADSPLTLDAAPATLSATAGSAFDGAVATLTDSDTGVQASDFTVTIDWGDGTVSDGTLRSNGQGGLDVLGNHTYTGAGDYSVQVDVTAGDSTAETYSDLSVSAAAASQFEIDASTDSTPGAVVSITVIAEDPFGNPVDNYAGTVHFTSSDTLAGLPADYTFTADDAGSHDFDVTLESADNQTVTATDTADGSFSGSAGIVVHADATPSFLITADDGATVGMPTTFTVTAVDAFGNPLPTYTGTVHFTSSDALAVLPADYTFTAADQGSQTFTATLREPGSPTIDATDTADAAVTGETNLWVATATSDQVAYADDGSMVVSEALPSAGGQDLVLLRYGSDGALDATFGSGGEVILRGLTGPNQTAPAVALQSDGKVIVAGSAPGASGLDFVVQRYDTDGSLDTSFGGSGTVDTAFAGADAQADAQAVGVAVPGDGGIVVAGTVHTASGSEFGLARYNSDGSLDTTFGTGGLVTTAFDGDATATSVSILYNGEIDVSGQSTDGSYLSAYYNRDGSQDLSGPSPIVWFGGFGRPITMGEVVPPDHAGPAPGGDAVPPVAAATTPTPPTPSIPAAALPFTSDAALVPLAGPADVAVPASQVKLAASDAAPRTTVPPSTTPSASIVVFRPPAAASEAVPVFSPNLNPVPAPSPVQDIPPELGGAALDRLARHNLQLARDKAALSVRDEADEDLPATAGPGTLPPPGA
jgi:uncharacterized delta-60 repeat protein